MYFLDGKFLSGCLCTLKSKKPLKTLKTFKNLKNLKTKKNFFLKNTFFPTLGKAEVLGLPVE